MKRFIIIISFLAIACASPATKYNRAKQVETATNSATGTALTRADTDINFTNSSLHATPPDVPNAIVSNNLAKHDVAAATTQNTAQADAAAKKDIIFAKVNADDIKWKNAWFGGKTVALLKWIIIGSIIFVIGIGLLSAGGIVASATLGKVLLTLGHILTLGIVGIGQVLGYVLGHGSIYLINLLINLFKAKASNVPTKVL